MASIRKIAVEIVSGLSLDILCFKGILLSLIMDQFKCERVESKMTPRFYPKEMEEWNFSLL